MMQIFSCETTKGIVFAHRGYIGGGLGNNRMIFLWKISFIFMQIYFINIICLASPAFLNHFVNILSWINLLADLSVQNSVLKITCKVLINVIKILYNSSCCSSIPTWLKDISFQEVWCLVSAFEIHWPWTLCYLLKTLQGAQNK